MLSAANTASNGESPQPMHGQHLLHKNTTRKQQEEEEVSQ